MALCQLLASSVMQTIRQKPQTKELHNHGTALTTANKSVRSHVQDKLLAPTPTTVQAMTHSQVRLAVPSAHRLIHLLTSMTTCSTGGW